MTNDTRFLGPEALCKELSTKFRGYKFYLWASFSLVLEYADDQAITQSPQGSGFRAAEVSREQAIAHVRGLIRYDDNQVRAGQQPGFVKVTRQYGRAYIG